MPRPTLTNAARRMTPGTLGGQSWSATPVAPPAAKRQPRGVPKTVIATLLADTYIDSENVTVNSGSLDHMVFAMPYGYGPGSFGRPILLNFDISVVPVGVFVVSAKLTLTTVFDGGGANRGQIPHLQARRVLHPQDPATATFTKYDATHNWDSLGGGTAGVDTALNACTGPDVISSANPGDTYFVDVGLLVAGALTATYPTLYLMCTSNSYMADSNPVWFASLEHATVAYRPTLTVTYLA